MKKRCEICGKIYESYEAGRGNYIHIDAIVHPTLRDDGHYEDKGRATFNRCNYDTCDDCVKKVSDFVENLIEDNTEETEESDAPKKTGRWALCYNPVTDYSLVKCTECGFTIEENGRVNTFMLEECPQCKAKMEVYVRDYSF